MTLLAIVFAILLVAATATVGAVPVNWWPAGVVVAIAMMAVCRIWLR